MFSLRVSECKGLWLTPSGVGTLHQAQPCLSSAAEPHAAPKRMHRHRRWPGTASALPLQPQTASAGTLRAAVEMGPEHMEGVNLKFNAGIPKWFLSLLLGSSSGSFSCQKAL